MYVCMYSINKGFSFLFLLILTIFALIKYIWCILLAKGIMNFFTCLIFVQVYNLYASIYRMNLCMYVSVSIYNANI